MLTGRIFLALDKNWRGLHTSHLALTIQSQKGERGAEEVLKQKVPARHRALTAPWVTAM